MRDMKIDDLLYMCYICFGGPSLLFYKITISFDDSLNFCFTKKGIYYDLWFLYLCFSL